jgi:hypothetical protein
MAAELHRREAFLVKGYIHEWTVLGRFGEFFAVLVRPYAFGYDVADQWLLSLCAL